MAIRKMASRRPFAESWANRKRAETALMGGERKGEREKERENENERFSFVIASLISDDWSSHFLVSIFFSIARSVHFFTFVLAPQLS